jgi:multiple antibiotic resistance protein
MNTFWLCFVPLFVAVDAVGVLPMFVTLTEGLDPKSLRTIILQSVVTASAVALGFLFLGAALLRFLGITVSDFMIAGGILLLAISLSDLLTGEKRLRQTDPAGIGAVPIGVPLITGPAVLTACLLLGNLHGNLVTAAAVLVNIGLAGVIFLFSTVITRGLGRTGTRIVSKIASLFLAAIAVMLIRRGISGILEIPVGS